MAHKLLRLMEQVYNTPHLITPSALKPIVEYLEKRNSPEFAFMPEDKVESKPPQSSGKIGQISVDGAMTYRPVYGACGEVEGTSYQSILEQAEYLIEQGVDTLVMIYSSPGGQASHCFTTAQDLRSMADESNVKLISYVDEMAASAALALSIVSDEVIVHPSSSIGSIGCVCCIVDYSKALEKEGVKPIYIASTPGKTGFNPDGSYSTKFLDELQEEVSGLGNQFANHVHEFTGIPVDEILAMDAKMYNAQEAVEVGLANKVMDHREFANYLEQIRGK